MSTLAERFAANVDTSSHDPVHVTCCRDRDRSLCGIRDDHWDDIDYCDDAEECIVCHDLDLSDTCPLYGPGGCRGDA